jgi:4-diphosphocytidyl-2-C-methyl-D-erythritol kinase
MSVRVFAPAKINLTLKVGRPRADGMHPLQSVAAFADVGDWIEADVQLDSPIHVRGPFGDALAREIDFATDPVSRAFKALQRDRSAAITLEKNLPLASGIGGGSTDAAATLKALNAVWERGLSESELMALGAAIGADVPVCIGARTAWMTGIGEVITPIELPPLSAVLVNPLRPLATVDVYRQFDRMGLGSALDAPAPPQWASEDDAIATISALGNDLEAPASSLLPLIGDALGELRADSVVRYAAMSGSGATLFALTEDRNAAETLAHRLKRRLPGWWIAATRLGA